MPGLDHKGPQGEGPMTGRRAGKCTTFSADRAGKADAEGGAEEVGQTGTGRGGGRGTGARHGGGRGTGARRGGGRGSGAGHGAGQGTGRGAGAGRGASHGARSGRGRGR